MRLIKAARLFDGVKQHEHAYIVIDGDRIREVGQQQDLGASCKQQFEETIELDTEQTLLPGLINMHTHLSFSGARSVFHDATTESDVIKTVRIVDNLRRALATGVTTVRDCGTWPRLALPIRNAVEHGLLPGPRIIASGAITTTGGHCWYCATEADSEDEVRKAVRAHTKDGVDFIKLFATGGNTTQGSDALTVQYTREQLCAATEEARKANRRTAVHAHAFEGVRNSIDAGVTTIEHCSFQTGAGIGWDEEMATQIVDKGIFVCHTTFRAASKFENDSAFEFTPAEIAANAKRQQRVALTRRLHDKGVRLIAGNDAGVSHVSFDDFPGDLIYTAQACGLDSGTVLRSATSVAAEALGRDDLGTIAAGKVADLLVVRGNPIADVTSIAQTECVYTRGQLA